MSMKGKLMRRFISLLLAALFVTAPAFSQKSETSGAQEELVEAEKAFARYCVEHGIRDAWLEFFADDGVIFKPGPVNAKEFYRKRPPAQTPLPATLNWEPRYGDVSLAGDMGYDIGPWNYVSNTTPKEPDSHGYFFSIWKKQPDGKWKVAVDVGTGEIKSATADHVFGKPFQPARQYKPKVPRGLAPAAELRGLTEMERGFAANAKSAGALNSYLALVADDAKTFKPNTPPAGKEAIRSFIPAGSEMMLTLAPVGGGVAVSRDMAYTYGSYEIQESGRTREKGYYAHMWKRDEAGRWKVVVTNFHSEQTP